MDLINFLKRKRKKGKKECAVAQKYVTTSAAKIREGSPTQLQPGVNFMSNFSALLKGDVYILLTEALTALFPSTSIMKSCCYNQEITCCSSSFQS